MRGRYASRWVAAILVGAAWAWGRAGAPPAAGPDPYLTRRLTMVERDLKLRGVCDPAVLEAMRTVPRHEFVPPEWMDHAYDDGPLPIGMGQTISQPYIVAAMTEALRVDTNSVVLEVGTGSGYQAAVLSLIAREVYTIEIIPELGESARARLARLGYDNVEVRIGDGYNGWPEHAPFDGIVVTAAAPAIPPPLVEQLKVGGRMVIPVGPPGTVQELKVVEKTGEKTLREQDTMAVRFVPLTRNEGE